MSWEDFGGRYVQFGGCVCGMPLAIYAWYRAAEDFGFWGLLFGWVASIPAFFLGTFLGPVVIALWLLAIGVWWLCYIIFS